MAMTLTLLTSYNHQLIIDFLEIITSGFSLALLFNTEEYSLKAHRHTSIRFLLFMLAIYLLDVTLLSLSFSTLSKVLFKCFLPFFIVYFIATIILKKKKNINNSFFNAVVFLSINLANSIILNSIESLVKNWIVLLIICVSLSLCTAINIFFIDLQIKKNIVDIGIKSTSVIIAFLFIDFVLIAMYLIDPYDYFNDENEIITFKSFVILLTICFELLFTILSYRYNEENQESKLLLLNQANKNITNDLFKEQTDNYELHKYRHDMNKSLKVINQCILDHELTLASDLIEEIIGSASSNTVSNKYSSSSLLNAILTSAIDEGNSKGVKVDVDIKDFSSLNIGNLDLLKVVPNIISNGIKAIIKEDTSDKRLLVKIIIKNNFFFLATESYTVYEQVPRHEQNKVHGYGLYIIDSIAKKYGGNYQEVIVDHTFITNLMMNNVAYEK